MSRPYMTKMEEPSLTDLTIEAFKRRNHMVTLPKYRHKTTTKFRFGPSLLQYQGVEKSEAISVGSAAKDIIVNKKLIGDFTPLGNQVNVSTNKPSPLMQT